MRETKHMQTHQVLRLYALTSSARFQRAWHITAGFDFYSYKPLMLSSIGFVSWLILHHRLTSCWDAKFRFDRFESISSESCSRCGFVFTYSLTSGPVGLEHRLSHELFLQCTNNNSTAHRSQEEQDKDFLQVTYADSLEDLELHYEN